MRLNITAKYRENIAYCFTLLYETTRSKLINPSLFITKEEKDLAMKYIYDHKKAKKGK